MTRLIVFFFSFLLYVNTVPNKYNLDDELVTTVDKSKPHRLTSKGVAAIPEIFREPYYADEMGYAYDYRPLVHVTFAIEHSLFGNNPHAGHFINTLLYSLLCLLLLAVLNGLLNGFHPMLPLLITLLFAAHPIHTEVVASLKNRDEILALIGALSAVYFFVRFCRNKKITAAIAGVACFTLGMLSKQTIISFVFLTPILLILFSKPTQKQILSIPAVLGAVAFWFVPTVYLDVRVGMIASAVIFSSVLFNIRNPQAVLSFLKKIGTQFSSWGFALKLVTKTTISRLKPTSAKPLSALASGILAAVILVTAAVLFFQNSSYYAMALLGFFPLCAFSPQATKRMLKWTCLAITGFLIFITGEEDFFVIFFAILLLTEGKNYRLENLILVIASFTFGLLKEFELNIGIFLAVVGIIGMTFTSYFRWFRWFLLVAYAAGTIADLVQSSFYWVDFLLVSSTLLIIFFPKRIMPTIVLITLSLCLILYTYIPLFPTAPLLNFSFKGISIPTVRYERPQLEMETRTFRPIDYVETTVDEESPLSKKWGTGMVIVGKYLKLVLIPYPMSFYYGYKVVEATDANETIPIIVSFILLFLLIASLMMVKEEPLVSAGLFIFIISLLPLANIVRPVPGMMADRYLFIPSLGFCMLLSYILLKLWKGKYNLELSLKSLPVLFVCATLAILLLYSGITVARNFQWRDSLTLMRNDIGHLDESAQAHNLLATHLVKKAVKEINDSSRKTLLTEAESHFEKALSVYPDFFNAAYDLGRVRMMQGKYDEAEAPLITAVKIDSTFSEPFFQIGFIKMNRGDYSGAIAYYENYLRLASGSLDALVNISFCYAQIGNLLKSLFYMKEAVRFHPQNPDPLINVTKIFLDLGKPDSASYYLYRAEQLSPRHPEIPQLKRAISDKVKLQ